MKSRYLPYLVVIALVPFAYFQFLRPNTSLKEASLYSHGDTTKDHYLDLTSIKVPLDDSLFGKVIPLKDHWELRERFEREFYYNLSNQDQLILWYKRLKRWEPMLDSTLDANGLNRDLKYLMIAESGVRNVESPAHANGFWQFIPPTAQRWGLRVDNDIDERLDPFKATAAAMRYLGKLKQEFGDYFLVAAAYNRGESDIELAMQNQHQGSYWNLYLNEETMRYVFRIAVIKKLLENGGTYGLHFDQVSPYQRWDVKHITVDGPISSISDWARDNGFAYKDIKIYNPWLVGRSIPNGEYQINVPASDSARTTVRD